MFSLFKSKKLRVLVSLIYNQTKSNYKRSYLRSHTWNFERSSSYANRGHFSGVIILWSWSFNYTSDDTNGSRIIYVFGLGENNHRMVHKYNLWSENKGSKWIATFIRWYSVKLEKIFLTLFLDCWIKKEKKWPKFYCYYKYAKKYFSGSIRY